MKKRFLFLVKLVISLSIFCFLLYRIFTDKEAFEEALYSYQTNLSIILAALLLMPFNYLMEVFKWQLSIKSLTYLPFKQATAGVLSGVSLGFVTPHAVGDYFAKIWSFSHEDRKKALGPILVARMSQMIPTLAFGAVAFIVFIQRKPVFDDYSSDYTSWLIPVAGLIAFLLLSFLFIKYGVKNKKWMYYFDLIRKLQLKSVAQLVALSSVRYFIFSVQFMLLLSIFSFPISFQQQFLGIAFMFLAKSVLPTFNFFNDLGIREFSAVLYFETFDISAAPVILASLLLWLINIALPALIGLFFVPQFKIDPS
ncbi:lysylphosphatidylglycerol synthase domain-containing protein [Marivirga lumbricoides]|uniref:lysylphosphatidylglycerol synthase domain-containing protein n=1 Tax=Marivirga lumbricoides TaxID=1046115 RepID=UPI00166452B8